MSDKISREGIEQSYAIAIEQFGSKNPRALGVLEKELGSIPEELRLHVKELVALALFDSFNSCKFTARRIMRMARINQQNLPQDKSEQVYAATQKIAQAVAGLSRSQKKKIRF